MPAGAALDPAAVETGPKDPTFAGAAGSLNAVPKAGGANWNQLADPAAPAGLFWFWLPLRISSIKNRSVSSART